MIRLARYVLVPALIGVLSVGSAWAGAGLAPPPQVTTPDDVVAAAADASAARAAAQQAGQPGAGVPDHVTLPPQAGAGGGGVPVPDGPGLLVGAAKVSIAPDPDPAKGEHWETEGCETLGADAAAAPGHLLDLSNPWPRNPDCIYVGGYDIGPMNAAVAFDEDYGLWARSVAMSDGDDTLVLTVIDGVYWFARYASMCDACGAYDLAEQLGAELGIDPAGLVFTATHSHTAPDFIGGWGGVPQWYMEQAAEAMRRSVRAAVADLRLATVEAGEVLAREHNRERRNTYRSAEEAGLSWLRATDTATGETIATVGAYAAHPTTVSFDERIAHPDWPGVFNAGVEERFGGIGLHFMTGLGNMSAAGGTQMGAHLAAMVPEEGTPLASTDVRVAQARWDQPVTNAALTALAVPGFFDRPFDLTPAAVSEGKSEERPCTSASPVSVDTSVSAARVGELVFTAAPGEIFSNYSNTIKERVAGPATIAAFPLGMANDATGYIMQSVETFDEGRTGLGFAGTKLTEYEDAYSLDRCFGDMALETTLRLLQDL